MVGSEAHGPEPGNPWGFSYHPAPLYSNIVSLNTIVYLLLAHLPISQTVGHDNGGGVFLERRNNVRTTSHLAVRYMLLDAKKEGWMKGNW